MILARSFLFVTTTDDSATDRLPGADARLAPDARRFVSEDRRAVLVVWDIVAEVAPERASQVRVLIGDDMERAEVGRELPLGAAAQLRFDLSTGEARITASVTGLPPLFMDVSAAPTLFAVATSVQALRTARSLALTFEPQSVVELLHVGFPLQWRTLFRDVTIVPAGAKMAVARGRSVIESPSTLFGEVHADGGARPIDQQVELFRVAAGALDLGASVLSLSGGLDTRAIFSELAARSTDVPAVTMSGAHNLGLDARIARALCRHYGMRHEVIDLGPAFLSDLPAYTRRASLLSNGLASIGQAHEVYMSARIAQLGSRRISGNLGNQVGRQGVEGISIRGADLSILAADVRDRTTVSSTHWIEEAVTELGGRFFDALITREVPYSSVGNYAIGHAFAVQQSPYASRPLIAYTAKHPVARHFDPTTARRRDLHHRFLGPPVGQSFQRRAIAMRGGFASRYPINWGWRAAGGVSPSGALMGAASLVDALSDRLPVPARVLRATGVAGLHVTRPLEEWVDRELRDFIRDSLGASGVEQSGWFDPATLRSVVDRHFDGTQPNYGTVMAALDLALAIENFIR